MRNFCFLKKLILSGFIGSGISIQAWPQCGSSNRAESAAQEPNRRPPVSEVALANMLIYSQEYMRNFFADADSDVQPLPASGMSIFTGFGVSTRSRFLTALTLPLREEEVKKRNAETFRYYYPKLLMLGYELDWMEIPIFSESSCLRMSAGAGLALPLSNRFLKYFPPFALSRAALRIAPDVDLNFGVGYSGNIGVGAWFFPFGISYRMDPLRFMNQ